MQPSANGRHFRSYVLISGLVFEGELGLLYFLNPSPTVVWGALSLIGTNTGLPAS
jgi:hypothetical protein